MFRLVSVPTGRIVTVEASRSTDTVTPSLPVVIDMDLSTKTRTGRVLTQKKANPLHLNAEVTYVTTFGSGSEQQPGPPSKSIRASPRRTSPALPVHDFAVCRVR